MKKVTMNKWLLPSFDTEILFGGKSVHINTYIRAFKILALPIRSETNYKKDITGH